MTHSNSGFRGYLDIIAIVAVATTLLVLTIIGDTSIVRFIIACSLIFFIPGHLITNILFRKPYKLSRLEKIVVSVFFSICLVVIGGLILDISPYNIDEESVVLLLVYSTLLLSSLELIIRLASNTNLHEPLHLRTKQGLVHAYDNIRKRPLRGVILLASAIIIVIMMFNIFVMPGYDPHTVLYIKNQEGSSIWPIEHSMSYQIGQEIDLVVGVVNHERKDMQYELLYLVTWYDVAGGNITNVTLLKNDSIHLKSIPLYYNSEFDEQWESNFSYRINETGPQRLWFILCSDDYQLDGFSLEPGVKYPYDKVDDLLTDAENEVVQSVYLSMVVE